VERGYTLDSAVRYCSCSSRRGGSIVAGILDLGLRGEKGGEGDLYSKTLDIGLGGVTTKIRRCERREQQPS